MIASIHLSTAMMHCNHCAATSYIFRKIMPPTTTSGLFTPIETLLLLLSPSLPPSHIEV